MADYKDLEVWRKAMQLAREVYIASRDFPRDEIYGLTNQIRRSAVSIPYNIAEGSCRSGFREFLQFLAIARGSSAELETQLMLASQIGYLQSESGVFEKIVSVH